jgi:hypothetical protein
VSKTNWAYLAALYDGEGCFHICRQPQSKGTGVGYRLDMPIGMSSLKTMRWLVSNFGGSYTLVRKDTRFKSTKQMYRWLPMGNKERKEKVLLGILPYLVEKQDQALVALNFVRLDSSFNQEIREQLYQELRQLKRASVETDTLESEQSDKIQSELQSNLESVPQMTAEAPTPCN